MRDKKLFTLLIVSLLSLFISTTLLFTWGYDYFINKDRRAEKVLRTGTQPRGKFVTDTPQQISSSNHKGDSQLLFPGNNPDSTNANMDVKLREFYALKNEIAILLQNYNTGNDLELARQKIAELQERTEELKNRNILVEDENKRLVATLQQLSRGLSNSEQPSGTNAPGNITRSENVRATTAFKASDLRLFAVMSDDEKEVETSAAGKAGKLVGSFVVRNSDPQGNVAEIHIVIVQPDGRILKSSPWESGTFETPGGKKIYSYKLRFDYTRGELKQLSISAGSENFQPGEYVMQVYYNGVMIGSVAKRLT